MQFIFNIGRKRYFLILFECFSSIDPTLFYLYLIKRVITMSTFSLFKFDKILYPKNRILAHLIFWFIYLGYFTLAFASFRDNYTQSFIEVLVTLPVRMFATYLTLYWLISGFLDKEKYISFTIIFILTAIGFGYLDRLLLHLFYVPI